jgi:hypothetical protein
VVTKWAEGAADGLLALAIAPIAPEPSVPVVSVPVKLITVIEADGTVLLNDADTLIFVSGEVANARHISAVPR